MSNILLTGCLFMSFIWHSPERQSTTASTPAPQNNSTPVIPSGSQNQAPQTGTEPQQMPPDTKAPPAKAAPPLNSQEARTEIQKHIDSEPGISKNSHIRVQVIGNRVVLVGYVQDERERRLALQIAQSYSGRRKLVDRLAIKQRAH
jgi:hypothetical protein